jgi:hypothetical protein
MRYRNMLEYKDGSLVLDNVYSTKKEAIKQAKIYARYSWAFACGIMRIHVEDYNLDCASIATFEAVQD